MATPEVPEKITVDTYILKITALDQTTRAKLTKAQLKLISRGGDGINVEVGDIYDKQGEPTIFKLSSLKGDDLSYKWLIRVFNPFLSPALDVQMIREIRSNHEIEFEIVSAP